MASCTQQCRLGRDEDSGEFQLSCAGLTLPHKPYSRVTDLLPLFNPLDPLERRFRRRPPLSCKRLPRSALTRSSTNRRYQEKRLLETPLPTQFSRFFSSSAARAEAIPDMFDSYGRECYYSGSCVSLIQDYIVFTGNDGKMRVSKFQDSESSIFEEVPGPGVKIRDRLLSSSRIFSLHPRMVGSVVVLARHRQGVAVYRVQGNRTGRVSRVTSLPCSSGLASVCWTGGGGVATVGGDAMVRVWDLEREGRTGDYLLPGGELDWSWASSGPGHHPASVLVGERKRCHSMDTRSGTWSQVGLGLTGQDQVRHLDSDLSTPYCYILTDRNYLLCDLRQPREPVLIRPTYLGRVGMAPSGLWGRTRVQSEDWLVAGDSWGELRLSVLDWGHSHCHLLAPQSDQVSISCQSSSCPRILGPLQSIGSWRDTVIRARSLGGEWLEAAVEERVGLPFTGLDLTQDKAGNVVIFAVNAVGDVFGKKIYLDDGCDEALGDDSSDDNTEEVERWLTNWGEAVLSNSYLPKVTLSKRFTEPRSLKSRTSFKLPVFIQSESWKRRFKRYKKNHPKKPEQKSEADSRVPRITKRTSSIPSITDAEWPEHLTEYDPKTRMKFVNIEALKEAMEKREDHDFVMDKPMNYHIKKSKFKDVQSKCDPLSLIIDKKLEEEENLRDEIHQHVLPQFKKLNLDDFYSSDSSNENSRRILRIMLGEMDDKTEAERGRRMSTSSAGLPSPAPPTEEDSTFAMASFWEDLGVDVPPSSQKSVEEDQNQFDEEEYEL